MYDNIISLDREEIYDILCGCNLFNVYTKDYGSLVVVDEDNIMEDFIPQVIDYINEKMEEKRLLLE